MEHGDIRVPHVLEHDDIRGLHVMVHDDIRGLHVMEHGHITLREIQCYVIVVGNGQRGIDNP